MTHFFHRSLAKKPESRLFSWLDRKQYGWFALLRLAKTPPSVSCCWFQCAFCLRNEQLIHTRVRYEISANSVFLNLKNTLKYFPFHRLLKIAVKNSPIIWMQFDTGYKLQKRQTPLTFKIINSWMESWPGLTVIPPSETCELVWAIFAVTTLFSLWNMMLQPNFFCFRHRRKSTSL